MARSIILVYFSILLVYNEHLREADGFNIDSDSPTIKHGPDGSLFGLSVAEHHIHTSPNSTTDMYLLAGAPMYGVPLEGGRATMQRTGTMYKCPITQLSEDCIRVDNIEQNEIDAPNDGQWLGVQVVSQAPGGKVVVCAHRWKGNVAATMVNSEKVVDTLYGRCFVLDSAVNSVLSCNRPCEGDSFILLSKYQYCQAGVSVAISPDDFIYYGSPGAYDWTGTLWSYDDNEDVFEQTEKSFISHKSLTDGAEIPKNSYVGFSMASGFIAARRPIVVTGAPRGHGTGLVLVYERAPNTTKLKLVQTIRGDTIASAFGYAIALIDLDGNDLQDIIVGAPQYYDPVNRYGGAVYVYANNGNGMFVTSPSRILYGSFDSAFGYSIASLGDVNIDGYNDFAVGAPQAFSNNGSVYIFHGGPHPENDRPAQSISGDTWFDTGLLQKPLSGFGTSLSGGLDMDMNGYPDLLIGTLSDTVVLLRGRPIIDVHVSLASTLRRLSFQTQEASIFALQICVNYTSRKGVVKEPVDIGYRITLDSSSEYEVRRISFNESTLEPVFQSSLPVRSTTTCWEMPLYTQRSVVDKLSRVIVSFEYSLTSSDDAAAFLDNGLVRMENHPIIGEEGDPSAVLVITPSLQCGEDDICQSKIEFGAAYMENLHGAWERVEPSPGGSLPLLILGQSKRLGIRITVTNKGENAHQAKLRVTLPDGIHLVKIDPAAQNLAFSNFSMATIDLGNPFKANSSTTFTVEFSVDVSFRDMDTITSSLTIETSSEQQGLNQPFPLQCLVLTEGFVEVLATSNPSRITPTGFNAIGHNELRNKPAREVGTLVTHTYEILNRGTVSLNNIEFELSWPASLVDGGGQWLLYYLGYGAQVSQRESTSEIKCHAPEPNPLDLAYKGSLSRGKREAPNEVKKLKPENGIMCPSYTGCITINCTLQVLATGERVVIDVVAVAWNETFIKEFGGRFYSVSVGSSFTIKKSNGNVRFSTRSVTNATTATEVVLESFFSKPVSSLLVLGGIAAGAVILAFIVIVCRRCGYFERRVNVYQASKHKQLSAAVDDEREENQD